MNTQRVEGHTPGKWHVGEQNDSLYIINRVPDPMNCRDWVGQGNPDTKVIAKVWQENEEANAAFIVHACNNIERLEKVNEALVRALEGLLQADDKARISDIEIKACRAALSLAKEPA